MSNPKTAMNLSLNSEYKSWLKELKQKVLPTKHNPIGQQAVAQLTQALPKELQSQLLSIEEIEQGLGGKL